MGPAASSAIATPSATAAGSVASNATAVTRSLANASLTCSNRPASRPLMITVQPASSSPLPGRARFPCSIR